MCLQAKDHLEGTKVAVSPSLCAPQERPVRQRSGLAVTEERRAEWTTVSRYGHLRSARSWWTLLIRTEREPPTLRAALSDSTRQSWRLLDDYCFSDDAFRTSRGMLSAVHMPEVTGPEGRQRSRSPALLSWPCGLWALMRYPVQVDSTARHFTPTLIVELALSLRMTADQGLLRALAGCGRRCAALFPQGRTGLPSTHSRCEFRSESSMKASTSFTESEDQCLCGQFKSF